MTTEPDHWSFFKLPPFFTLQPKQTALARQTSLWCSVILDHAAFYAPNMKEDTYPFLRLYKTTSDVFCNSTINKRLAPSAAKYMLNSLAAQWPNYCVLLPNNSDDDETAALLVACNEGGLKALEDFLFSWILERGAGTTSAHLAHNGVVMTFDELVQKNCLRFKHEKFLQRLSGAAVPVGNVGALTNEQAIRFFLQALRVRPLSTMRSVPITFFNLDGSEKEPYEGVKFGGAC